MAVEAPLKHEVNVAARELRLRLNELKAVGEGWAADLQDPSFSEESYGDVLNPEYLDWLADQFDKHYDFNSQGPYFCPGASGTVAGEWTLGNHRASLEVDLEARSGEWVCVNVKTLKSEARHLDLAATTDWDWLNAVVSRLELGLE